jgi:hypothetical protein
MKQRCFNPANICFENYGGRGITVCDRWINSYENFLADLGQRPDGKTLDRIDNDRGYEPGNCRWATYSEQMRNKRCNVLNETTAMQIRWMFVDGGLKEKEIADAFEISLRVATDCARGITWRADGVPKPPSGGRPASAANSVDPFAGVRPPRVP